MKRILVMVCTAVLLIGAAPAHAQQGGDRRGQRNEQKRPPPQQSPEWPVRDERDRDRGSMRPGQLSPDERRQLRRDISDHGRDIYDRDGRR